MNEEQTLQEIENAKIKSQADEIASAKIQELQDNISSAMGGTPDDNKKYDSMSDMRNDIDRRAEEKAKQYSKQAVEDYKSEVKAEETRVKEAKEAKAKQTVEDQKKEWSKMTDEWKEAVADGLAPAISDDLNKKLEEGVKYADLTPEERQDEGLQFYNHARKVHAENKRTGKATSFYRTMTQIDAKPSSAKAPVFGGGVAGSSKNDEMTDSELNEATNRVMNMGLPTK